MLTLSLCAMTTPFPQHPDTRAKEPSPAARATNELGIALYHALARENPGKNTFLSPLSITVAVAMLAEGARDETAAEFARAMGLGTNTDFTPLHADFQAVLARYRNGGGAADPALRERIATLRAQLTAANAEAERLGRTDWRAAGTAVDRARETRRLDAEIERLREIPATFKAA